MKQPRFYMSQICQVSTFLIAQNAFRLQKGQVPYKFKTFATNINNRELNKPANSRSCSKSSRTPGRSFAAPKYLATLLHVCSKTTCIRNIALFFKIHHKSEILELKMDEEKHHPRCGHFLPYQLCCT